MELELDDLQKVNLSLDDNLSGLRDKLSSVYKLLHVCKKKYTVTLSVIKKVKADIYLASGHAQNYKELKDHVKVKLIFQKKKKLY